MVTRGNPKIILPDTYFIFHDLYNIVFHSKSIEIVGLNYPSDYLPNEHRTILYL